METELKNQPSIFFDIKQEVTHQKEIKLPFYFKEASSYYAIVNNKMMVEVMDGKYYLRMGYTEIPKEYSGKWIPIEAEEFFAKIQEVFERLKKNSTYVPISEIIIESSGNINE